MQCAARAGISNAGKDAPDPVNSTLEPVRGARPGCRGGRPALYDATATMADLFSTKPVPPLAELMLPQTLDDVVGQRHLLGPGKPLRLAFESRKLHSFILWGPPGVGKTTLGRLAARVTNSHFIAISAVLAGIKDIRGAIDEAQDMLDREGRPTVVFVDEIHSFNKTQQDALLPHVESGLLTLIGGTTEHPGMQVTNALLSRAQVYNLQPLSQDDFNELYQRALQHLPAVTLDADALALLGGYADGDGRRFLNLLEQVANAASGAGIANVDAAFAGSATSPSLRRADKSGDSYYEQISAFHKSVRGSQPDAALYWLARMLDGGVDPRQVTRRMIAIASEDIGNADPRALQLAMNAAEAVDRLGCPNASWRWRRPRRSSRRRRSPTRPTWPGSRPRTSSRATARAPCRSTCATRRPS